MRLDCVRMATMRTYGDGCGIAHALDLVGERWALLVVRELLLGPKRFTDLRDGLPERQPERALPAPARARAGRRSSQRRKLPPPAGSWVYELTDWGRELKPIVISLGTWALRSPSFPADAPGRHRLRHPRPRDVLRRRRRRRPDRPLRAPPRRARVPRPRRRRGDRASTAGPPTTRTRSSRPTPTTLSALIWERRELADALRAGDITIEGDQRAVTRFLELFPRPQAAPRCVGPRRSGEVVR